MGLNRFKLGLIGVLAAAVPFSCGTDDLTQSAKECIYLADWHYDAGGPGVRDQTDLNDEYVVFGNKCLEEITMTDWEVENSDGDVYFFPRYSLEGNSEATLHSGEGENTQKDLYWGSRIYPIWKNTGDRLTLRNPEGEIILQDYYIPNNEE